MTKKIFSCTFNGLSCRLVEVEADISNGLSSFSIVGLGDASVQESKERVRSGIKNSGAQYPQTKKTINLAPAELRKQGSLFDLPIAVAILSASKQIGDDKLKSALVVGELSLTGKVRKINGALAITQFAKEQGFRKIFLPKENALEASFIEGIQIYPLDNLGEFIAFCQNFVKIKPHAHSSIERLHQGIEISSDYSLSRIVGLHQAKRALSIAAAGGHNVLLKGPPGTGKTILGRAFLSLLPPMLKAEIIETTKIYSIAGLLDSSQPLIMRRPFREVHHSASAISILGGVRPGEVTLAHNGVLFFDEITEFPRKIIESLRQPLEDRCINITRAKFSEKFPSNFIFIATMNPCPCGYHGDPKVKCICSEIQIKNYQKKLSGPIKDRIDLFVNVPRVSIYNLFNQKAAMEELSLLDAINRAGKIQNQRFADESNVHKNSDMTIREIRKYCRMEKETQKLLNQAAESSSLSNRSYIRSIKIARTIADLEPSAVIEPQHMAEALSYKT